MTDALKWLPLKTTVGCSPACLVCCFYHYFRDMTNEDAALLPWKTEVVEKMLTLLRQNTQYFNKWELLFQITKLGVGREDATNSATSSGLLYHDYLPFQSCALSSLLYWGRRARMGENNGSIGKVSGSLGMPFPCTCVFNSADELVW